MEDDSIDTVISHVDMECLVTLTAILSRPCLARSFSASRRSAAFRRLSSKF